MGNDDYRQRIIQLSSLLDLFLGEADALELHMVGIHINSAIEALQSTLREIEISRNPDSHSQ